MVSAGFPGRSAPRRRLLKGALAAGCACALGLMPITASAHAFLVRAFPGVGATVAKSPTQLTLTYTEAVVPHFCKVRLQGPNDTAIPIGPPRTAPSNPRVLVMAVPHLAPGRYTVTWHAVATDTHRTEGRFGFTVAGEAR